MTGSDRRLTSTVIALLLASSLTGIAQALALKWIIDGGTGERMSLAIAGAILGGVAMGTGMVVGRALVEIPAVLTWRAGLKIDTKVLDQTSHMPGIEHLERAEYFDQMELVRSGGQGLVRAALSVASSVSLVVRLAVGLALIATVHPLLVAVPLFALPSALLVPRAHRHIDQARSRSAEDRRASTALHELFLNPAAAMELRIFGCSDALDDRADARWQLAARTLLRGATRSALISSIGWVILAAGYVAALLFVAHQASTGRATLGDVVLVSQLALQLRGNVTQMTGTVQSAAQAMRTADRYLWLEDLANAEHARYSGTSRAPRLLTDGIRLDHVSFTYPGTTTTVLHDICLHLPAGATVAIVGENGAGKTTLTKLLTGLYRPTRGRILIDGADLADLDITDWRTQLAAGFQDFLRLETQARHSIGSGDPPAMDDDPRVHAALDRAASQQLTRRWPAGLATHLGKTYHDGIELSGGQWQRVAIARAMMRTTPLCLILDEPTAALDPAAEQALYERYSGAARQTATNGGTTILISHRFSSVRMADLIVVLQNGRLIESGSHHQLLHAQGTYATMFHQQAAAYTTNNHPEQRRG